MVPRDDRKGVGKEDKKGSETTREEERPREIELQWVSSQKPVEEIDGDNRVPRVRQSTKI